MSGIKADIYFPDGTSNHNKSMFVELLFLGMCKTLAELKKIPWDTTLKKLLEFAFASNDASDETNKDKRIKAKVEMNLGQSHNIYLNYLDDAAKFCLFACPDIDLDQTLTKFDAMLSSPEWMGPAMKKYDERFAR